MMMIFCNDKLFLHIFSASKPLLPPKVLFKNRHEDVSNLNPSLLAHTRAPKDKSISMNTITDYKDSEDSDCDFIDKGKKWRGQNCCFESVMAGTW